MDLATVALTCVISLIVNSGDCQASSGLFHLTNVTTNRLSAGFATQSLRWLTCLDVAVSQFRGDIDSSAVVFDPETKACEILALDLSVAAGSELKEVALTTQARG